LSDLIPSQVDSLWFERLPKVELHLHLEGAIPHAALWELVQKYGGDPELPDVEALVRRFEYRDFPHFIDTWVWKNSFIREYEDFTFFARAVAEDLLRQNVRYVEAFLSPPDFHKLGLQTQRIVEAVRRGLDQAPGVRVALVPDLVRDFGPEKARRTLAELSEVKDSGVVGVGIGGSEQSYPPEPFEQVYQEARRLGLHTSAHAGEAAGAESIWGAVLRLKAERIGHATRAVEDDALVDWLAEHQTPLEMCPLSNLCTGVVPSLDVHPVRRFFERGLLVTVNTDDPKMFGNSLAMEYQLLEARSGFSHKDICRLILNAVQACWLPDDAKKELDREIRLDPAFCG
jgi:adenosine deaminase